jgi:phage terminase large subunit-like protein
MIPSPSRLPQTRRRALDWYARILRDAAARSEEHLRLARRRLSQSDLFYLLVFTCGRRDINRDWLFDRCREFQGTPDGFLDLWAREHYKSTIITFGGTILDVLNEPDITVGIFSHTRPIAKAFLKQIKRELETNVDLHNQFPDILWSNPQKESPKWSEDEGIVVKRRANPKEGTIEAWGLVDGQPTSKHYRLKVYDDVVTRESVGTPDMILKTTSAWELSDNLGAEGGKDRYAGTIYHIFDTYSVIKERGVPTRIYPCTKDGSERFEPDNCVLMAPETLAEKRRKQGPYTFGAQMLLNPTADKAQGFQEAWLKYWSASAFANLNLMIIVDPASGKQAERRKNDFSSLWVIGYGADENYYVCDLVRDRLNLTGRQQALFELHRKWGGVKRIRKVGYEEYGMQADIEHIETVQERENYRFAITPLGGQLHKTDRIKRLVPTFEQGRLYLPQGGVVRLNRDKQQVDVIRQFVQEEYLPFPVLAHDDGLDSLSRIHDEEMKLDPPSDISPDLPSWRDELVADHGGPDFMTA